jgi:hypothetical protein
MKRIMISLLMVAATFNAFAVTFTGKAKLTLTSSDNKSCEMVIAESEDLNAGLNTGYYAALNEEGKEVQLYVQFGGAKYAHFASNAATMQDLQLGVKTNASTTYTLTASNVTGSLKIKFAGVEYTIDAAGVVFSDLALAANSVLPAAGDEANYVVNPSAPAAPGICFNYEKLQITGYDGAQVELLNYADKSSVFVESVSGDNVEIDLQTKGLTANTQYFVKLSPAVGEAKEYVIKYKPAVTTVVP